LDSTVTAAQRHTKNNNSWGNALAQAKGNALAQAKGNALAQARIPEEMRLGPGIFPFEFDYRPESVKCRV
jgi:hypothetical protein